MLAAFGPSKNPRARLQNSDITRHVAEALGREFSPWLGKDVIQAMQAAGWTFVRHSNRPWWKGVRKL